MIPTPPPLRLPRRARVRARADFDRVFADGRRFGGSLLALHVRAADGCRIGLAVSRKVDPRAVGRNRIKRLLRDVFRHARPTLAPGDYVFVARPAARAADAAALRAAALQLLERAGRGGASLPASGPAGTMPTASPPPSPVASLPSFDPPDRGPAEAPCPP